MSDPVVVGLFAAAVAIIGACGTVAAAIITRPKPAPAPPSPAPDEPSEGEQLWRASAYLILFEFKAALQEWAASSVDGLPPRFQRDPERFLPTED